MVHVLWGVGLWFGVGGASASDHMTGRAADFHAIGVELDELAKLVHSVGQSLPLAKAIVEFGQWMHVSIEPLGRIPTRRFLTAAREGGKTVYREWLV